MKHLSTVLLVVCSCSGKTLESSGPTCGAGTALIDGECRASRDAGVINDDRSDEEPEAGVILPPADPCLPQSVEVNCSTTCGDGTSNIACDALTCRPALGPEPTGIVRLKSDQRFVVRTPERPGRNQRCEQSCSSQHAAYALAFRVETPTKAFRITVGAPYRVDEVPNGQSTYCPSAATHETCAVFDRAKTLLVWTADPNAPARNVIVEPVPATTTCP
jgi:hypothetical protein